MNEKCMAEDDGKKTSLAALSFRRVSIIGLRRGSNGAKK